MFTLGYCVCSAHISTHTSQDNASELQLRGQVLGRRGGVIYRGRVEVIDVMDLGSCRSFRYINSPVGAYLNLSAVNVAL